DVARRGFAVPPKEAALWQEAWADLEGDAAATFELRGAFRNPAVADTLELAAAGRFYEGPMAEAIASVCWLSVDDLAAHQPEWVTLRRSARRAPALLALPPNGQGSIAGGALESLASPEPADQIAALDAAYAR